MGTKDNIQLDLATRLRTITAANGYTTDVQNVYGEDSDSSNIPMGLDLESYNLPAILILNGRDTPKHQQQWLVGNWLIHLQLIHKPGETDATMKQFVRDVMKAIYADSPTIQRNGEFRKLGQATNWHIVLVDPDVNMIDVNRFTEVVFQVQYHCHPTDL